MWISRARLAAVRRPVALWLSLVALATLPGCGLDGLKHMFDLPPTDCAAFTRGSFEVGRSGGDRELTVGESVEESVTPGLPGDCDAMVTSVTWSVDDPKVAALKQGAKAAPTAGGISRAWITGIAPGLTKVRARVRLTDGDHEAHAETVRVVAPGEAAAGSFVVAEGTAALTFNVYTNGGGSEPIPITLPASGRVDVAVDWTTLGMLVGFFLNEGDCAAAPCPGKLVAEAQLGSSKPVHGSVADLPAGDYTLRVSAVGSGQQTATYQVRLTPN
jgi:hypothetical protein